MKTKEGNNDVQNFKDDIEKTGDFFSSFTYFFEVNSKIWEKK